MTNSTRTPRRALVVAGVASILIVLTIQYALTANANSITWDEDDHIYAGYMSWKQGDFGLNPEHPPLVKLLAALPLLPMHLQTPPMQRRFFKLEAFLGGKDFIFHNTASADQILFRARMAASVLTLILFVLVFFAAREMFGLGAAFIALCLLVCDPTVLAHGGVVGTDMALACFMFASIYAFYRYVKAPSLGRLMLVGVAVGLALASKHSAILIFPMLLLLAIWEVLRRRSAGEAALPLGKRSWRMAVALVCIVALAVGILWAFYGFRYSARAHGLHLNPPFPDFVQGLSRPHDVRLLTTVASWRLLPESYIYGLADVRIMSDFYTSFAFGKVYPRGVWFYFPAAFSIKSSLTFLLLFVTTIWVVASGRLRKWREILFLTVPCAVHFIVAMAAGMNIGVRHILLIYFFLAVLIGGAMWSLIEKNRRWLYLAVALLIFQAVSVVRTYPAYLAYANELWGGPLQVHKLLSDSNADWAQQLKSTKKYLDQRGVKDCWFIYFAQGVVDFRDYGIPCKPLPTADSLWAGDRAEAPPVVDGPVLISAGDLSGFEFGAGKLNPYEQFKQLQPTAAIDYGVFVFDGRFEIPLAAALSHHQRAGEYLRERKLPEALNEAQQAVALAPDSVRINAILGDVLEAMGRHEEARASYQKALTCAKTIEPEFQVGWVEGLERRVAGK